MLNRERERESLEVTKERVTGFGVRKGVLKVTVSVWLGFVYIVSKIVNLKSSGLCNENGVINTLNSV